MFNSYIRYIHSINSVIFQAFIFINLLSPRGPRGQWSGPRGQWSGPRGQWSGPSGQWSGPRGQWSCPSG